MQPESVPNDGVKENRVPQPSAEFAQALEEAKQAMQATPSQNGNVETAIIPPEQSSANVTAVQLDPHIGTKGSKWRYFFIVLGILQLLGVGFFISVMASIGGKTGSEFIALALFATIVPVVGLIGFINIIGLPIYMAKHKPRGKGLVFSVLSLLLSTALALYAADTVYQFLVVAPADIKQSQQKIQAQQQKFVADNTTPEITKEQAINLLQTCQLKGFYYTNQTDKDKTGGGWGELSTTGVVLTKIDGKPYRISIANRLVSELVPVARQAQKTCGSPQFWHDGNYEQFHDGHWYFGKTIVN